MAKELDIWEFFSLFFFQCNIFLLSVSCTSKPNTCLIKTWCKYYFPLLSSSVPAGDGFSYPGLLCLGVQTFPSLSFSICPSDGFWYPVCCVRLRQPACGHRAWRPGLRVICGWVQQWAFRRSQVRRTRCTISVTADFIPHYRDPPPPLSSGWNPLSDLHQQIFSLLIGSVFHLFAGLN